MSKLIIVTILYIFCSSFYSQDSSNENNWRVFPTEQTPNIDSAKTKTLDYSKSDGKVNISKNGRIEAIENSLREKPYIYGYTIQLAVSQQKSVIQNARYKIIKIKSGIELDDPYESPNIYLFAGRFYDRASAYKFKHDIASHFPNAIVVGPKKMDLPRIKQDALVPVQDSTTNQ